MKRMISLRDQRLKEKDRLPPKKKKKEDPHTIKVSEAPHYSSALFFKYNTQLGPPFRILIDTNFVNFAIKNKLDVIQSMMDCLYAKCIPYVTDCVIGELEKLGSKYRVALRYVVLTHPLARSLTRNSVPLEGNQRKIICVHKCYIVATCDKDLKRRIRKVPGVPIMYIYQRRSSKDSSLPGNSNKQQLEAAVSAYPQRLIKTCFMLVKLDSHSHHMLTDIKIMASVVLIPCSLPAMLNAPASAAGEIEKKVSRPMLVAMR
ncbi:hypothetical protein HPB50_026896 [Hyalomma asiaticum]|uniref:Uncharacterized protein n=1 Tax=Hyalomma asiaticum TaxID=266040 RepID=A0ACB7S2T5_HYAAI|nr:hypothetical protein HPB50_026896 [Hyalomma asiaticum]